MTDVHHIGEKKLAHISTVADLMYERAYEMTANEKYAEEMYVLGFVHDIGYIFGAKDHSRAGGILLDRCGFKYFQEVYLHGKGNLYPEQDSDELLLLQWCDMSVGPGGVRMTCAERLEDIKERYGDGSEEHLEARRVIDRLAKHGMF